MFGEFSCLFHGNNFFCALPHCACPALLACFALGLRSPEKREKIAPVMQGISMQANCLRSNKMANYLPVKSPEDRVVLPIMACAGRLPPKVVPFRFQLYERVGRSVGSI